MTTRMVLYRKWRPKLFSEIVGQPILTRTLRQAVVHKRVAHAYLFCGPRGTGKTSTARILAKAQNCKGIDQDPKQHDAQTGEPDNTCDLCQSANDGRSLDIIEMDAASHRGIDDIRNLKERVFGSGPAEGQVKVYIIDEAHMLTEQAFNALLKTLEEPAPWAYFILCTTEPHKIPMTIVSRCQRFDFRRIATNDVQERLAIICQEEEISCENGVLWVIARHTRGSLRDACNILEQVVTCYGSSVKITDVQELLGLTEDGSALNLVDSALSDNISKGLGIINEIALSGKNLNVFYRDIIQYLRCILLIKSDVEGSFEQPAEVLEQLRSISLRTSWDKLIQTIKLFGESKLDAGELTSTLSLELLLVECSSPLSVDYKGNPRDESLINTISTNNLLNPSPSTTDKPQPSGSPEIIVDLADIDNTNYDPSQKLQDSMPPDESNPRVPSDSSLNAEANQHNGATRKPADESQWGKFYQLLRHTKGKEFILGALLRDCAERYVEDSTLILRFKHDPHKDRFQKELEHPGSIKSIEQASIEAFGKQYNLKLESANRNTPTMDSKKSHIVQAAQTLGAQIIEEVS